MGARFLFLGSVVGREAAPSCEESLASNRLDWKPLQGPLLTPPCLVFFGSDFPRFCLQSCTREYPTSFGGGTDLPVLNSSRDDGTSPRWAKPNRIFVFQGHPSRWSPPWPSLPLAWRKFHSLLVDLDLHDHLLHIGCGGCGPGERGTSSPLVDSAIGVGGALRTAMATSEDARRDLPERLWRTLEFWRRAGGIYLGYKVQQARMAVLDGMRKSQPRAQELHLEDWERHHRRAGADMYQLCIDLRGFYVKVGQFLGSRPDFVPKPVCEELRQLQDRVPPMGAQETRKVIEEEVGKGKALEDMFEWIDLEHPLGSASLAQVHKAKLRAQPECRTYQVRKGDTGFSIAKRHHMSMKELVHMNPGVDPEVLRGGQVLNVAVRPHGKRKARKGGQTVAVKVQYPSAEGKMLQDLANLRKLAKFLSQREINFDLVSAVDELHKQIKLEFDFEREARIMDQIHNNLRGIRKQVTVPHSVEGLTSRRVLVMDFVDGCRLDEMKDKLANVSRRQRQIAKRRILSNICEAYGKQILETGLFQADAHPGNILVRKGAQVALLDYGQSKQLTPEERKAFAKLVVSMNSRDYETIAADMESMGVVFEKEGMSRLKARVARNMFDTRGVISPFSESSEIKKNAITKFPSDMFFVMRVVQLIRGLAYGMKISDFSTAKQWNKYAKKALAEA